MRWKSYETYRIGCNGDEASVAAGRSSIVSSLARASPIAHAGGRGWGALQEVAHRWCRQSPRALLEQVCSIAHAEGVHGGGSVHGDLQELARTLEGIIDFICTSSHM